MCRRRHGELCGPVRFTHGHITTTDHARSQRMNSEAGGMRGQQDEWATWTGGLLSCLTKHQPTACIFVAVVGRGGGHCLPSRDTHDHVHRSWSAHVGRRNVNPNRAEEKSRIPHSLYSGSTVAHRSPARWRFIGHRQPSFEGGTISTTIKCAIFH